MTRNLLVAAARVGSNGVTQPFAINGFLVSVAVGWTDRIAGAMDTNLTRRATVARLT